MPSPAASAVVTTPPARGAEPLPAAAHDEPSKAVGPVARPVDPVATNELKPAELEPPPSPHEPTGFGRLIVRVQPWATVIVDGRKPEEVEGTKEFRLSAGDHAVRLVHQKSVVRYKVSIRPGKDRVVTHSFAPGATPASE